MAADLERILRDLAGVYDFSGKDVVYVGAGGGRLLPAVGAARRIQAVDQDAPSLEALRAAADAAGLSARLVLTRGDFMALDLRGDVVYFEFCLHEMSDPAAALARALRSAPEAVVLDHAPGSAWGALAGETEKTAAAWKALEAAAPRRVASFEGEQSFRDYGELRAKLAPLGDAALRRIEPYRPHIDFRIPMPYRAALLSR
ncbi:MAG: methyltransferase domain-containing protein [Elusimicrobiota bacterium]